MEVRNTWVLRSGIFLLYSLVLGLVAVQSKEMSAVMCFLNWSSWLRLRTVQRSFPTSWSVNWYQTCMEIILFWFLSRLSTASRFRSYKVIGIKQSVNKSIGCTTNSTFTGCHGFNWNVIWSTKRLALSSRGNFQWFILLGEIQRHFTNLEERLDWPERDLNEEPPVGVRATAGASSDCATVHPWLKAHLNCLHGTL